MWPCASGRILDLLNLEHVESRLRTLQRDRILLGKFERFRWRKDIQTAWRKEDTARGSGFFNLREFCEGCLSPHFGTRSRK